MYVLRNNEGKICGLFANLQPGAAEEYLEAGDPEIVEFYKSLNKTTEE